MISIDDNSIRWNTLNITTSNKLVTKYLAIREWKMMDQLGECNVDLCWFEGQASLYAVVIRPTLVRQVIEAQQLNDEANSFHTRLTNGEC